MSYDDIKSVLMSYDCVENHKLRPRPPKISDYVQSIVQSATVYSLQVTVSRGDRSTQVLSRETRLEDRDPASTRHATFPLPLTVSCYANTVQLYVVLTATAYCILGTYESIIDYVHNVRRYKSEVSCRVLSGKKFCTSM